MTHIEYDGDYITTLVVVSGVSFQFESVLVQYEKGRERQRGGEQ